MFNVVLWQFSIDMVKMCNCKMKRELLKQKDCINLSQHGLLTSLAGIQKNAVMIHEKIKLTGAYDFSNLN